MIENKVNGRQITVPPAAPARGRLSDLMTALKESFKTIERGKKKETAEGVRGSN
jgi:non-homologous end joining protein Ku